MPTVLPTVASPPHLGHSFVVYHSLLRPLLNGHSWVIGSLHDQNSSPAPDMPHQACVSADGRELWNNILKKQRHGVSVCLQPDHGRVKDFGGLTFALRCCGQQQGVYSGQ